MTEYVKTSVPADQQALWTAEANQWRLPYWDWAIPQPYIENFGVPEICTWEKITIVEPASKNREPLGRVEVANPLWKFSNPLGIPMGDPAMGVNAVGDADDAPVRVNLLVAISPWPTWF
jgi:tyrosinase